MHGVILAESKADKVFDRYETAGVVVPGASLLIGLWAFFPQGVTGVAIKDISLGSLGIFAIAAFCVGHVIQAPANVITDITGRWMKRPSEAMRHRGGGLSDAQVGAIPDRVRVILGVEPPPETDVAQWRGIIAQIATYLANTRKTARLDKFNGNYGLFRGLTVSLAILVGIVLWRHDYAVAGILTLATWATRYRMKRFSRYYGRELWLQFLTSNGPSRD